MTGNPDKKISILGCGWYGLELAKKLTSKGYSIKGSTTSPEKLTLLKESGIIPYLINLGENNNDFDHAFFDSELLIIAIPPKRNTSEQHTFVSKIQKIASASAASGIRQIIFISSTSVYGDQNAEIDEHTQASPDTESGKAILLAENLLQQNPSFKTTIIRFGGLIGPNRNPGKFFAGKKDIPNGQAPVNLIHLEDCIGITEKIIQKAAFGHIYNACAADHPSRAVFYTHAAIKSGLEPPQFTDELLTWKLINSITIPKYLDYTFNVPLMLL